MEGWDSIQKQEGFGENYEEPEAHAVLRYGNVEAEAEEDGADRTIQ